MLFVVATPIGNMQDLSFRAKEILETADIILAEDTRQVKKIFDVFQMGKTEKLFWSYHAKSSEKSEQKVFEALGEGRKIALVSDAGTPGISDPGTRLIAGCVERNLPVSPIPGASAIITALCASGLATNRFEFLGFLPHKKGRQKILQEIAQSSHTMIFYESVHRIEKCIAQMKEFFPEKKVCVARELTKIYEDFLRGTPEEIEKVFKEFPEKRKGEFVVLVEGMKK